MDIIVESFERRNVEHACFPRLPVTTEQLIEGPEKRGEGFSAAGRGRDQQVFPLGDQGPSSLLDFRGFGVVLPKPFDEDGVKCRRETRVDAGGCFGSFGHGKR